MSHVVAVMPTPVAIPGGKIYRIPVGSDNLAWLLVSGDQAVVIDGPEAGPVLAIVDALGLSLAAVWNTHIHEDHIGINRDLLRRGWKGAIVGPRQTADRVPGLTQAVNEGDVVHCGNIQAKVWKTEGHLRGHISYLIPGAIFCGDTLFAGGCGRAFESDFKSLFQSLLRIATLPKDTLVCCAHEYTEENLRFAWSVETENSALVDRISQVLALRGRGECTLPSTIGMEQATNPFLRPGSLPLRAQLGCDQTVSFLDVFRMLRLLKESKQYRELPWPPPLEPSPMVG